MSVIKQVEINDGVNTPVSADLGADAVNVSYDNTSSGLVSTNLQSALNEIIAQNGYAVCSTLGNVAAKVATISNFQLRTGVKIAIKFDNENDAANPTLNVSGTGAKALMANGAPATDVIKAGSVFLINYNGTSYDVVGGVGGQDAFIGTEAEWDALPAEKKNKYNGKLVYITDDYLPGGVIIQSTDAYILDKDNWDNQNVYDLEDDYPSSKYNVVVNLSSSATAEEKTAFNSANIVRVDNYNKIIATGTVPTVDINVVLTVTRKSVWTDKGSGHTIIDANGVSLAQRDNLQFTGGVTVTDDSTNGKTVVNIEGEQIQVATLPTASVDELGKVYQYLGADTNDYKHGYFYECKLEDSSYIWKNILVQDDETGTVIVQKPTVTVGTYTYNGSAQGPTITGLDTENTVVTNDTKVNAGTYTLTIALKNTQKMVWSDLTTADLTYTYTIDKATSDITLSKNSVTLNATTLFDTVTISNDLGRTLSVSSSDTSIVTASLNGNTITINNVDQKTGSVTLTVAAAANTNYNASNKTINVSAEFKPALVSWSSGTDTQIKAMVDAYYDGVLTLSEIQSVWSVGDSRTITLSAMSATGVGESHRSQSVEMVILDFNHDTLTTAVNGKTKALITVQQKNCLRDATVADDGGSGNTEHGYMNSSNTNVNGWRGCARRTWCNDVYYNALPSGFKAMVKQANHTTSTGNQQTTTEVTADYCFLPSEWEIFGAKSYAAVQEGTQYSYYTTATNRYKLPKWSSSSVSDFWWERSPRGSGATRFCIVNNYGNADGSGAGDASGLAPACCF